MQTTPVLEGFRCLEVFVTPGAELALLERLRSLESQR
jgi:hypothetical protein